MTWWENLITWGLSLLVLGVTIWGIRVTKKSNKDIKRLNLEQELAGIERELANIDVEIEREKSAGHEISSHVYGVPTTNPRICEIVALENKRDVLLKRKKEIIRQLEHL